MIFPNSTHTHTHFYQTVCRHFWCVCLRKFNFIRFKCDFPADCQYQNSFCFISLHSLAQLLCLYKKNKLLKAKQWPILRRKQEWKEYWNNVSNSANKWMMADENCRPEILCGRHFATTKRTNVRISIYLNNLCTEMVFARRQSLSVAVVPPPPLLLSNVYATLLRHISFVWCVIRVNIV